MAEKRLTGKFEKQERPTDQPPLVEHDLEKVLREYMSWKKLPEFMPPSPHDAATWWIDMQEKPSQQDRPHKVSVVGDDGFRWICPYHLRISYTLRKFLFAMKEAEQRIIMAAREDGVFWRGDDMYFFMLVIDETQRMRKIGVEAYREESLKKLKNFLHNKINS